jgi:hypothetical protein
MSSAGCFSSDSILNHYTTTVRKILKDCLRQVSRPLIGSIAEAGVYADFCGSPDEEASERILAMVDPTNALHSVSIRKPQLG